MPRSRRDQPSKEITEDDVKAAFAVINTDYWNDVRGVVAELEEAVKDGEITDEDQLQERMDQAVDGTQRVIYTWQAKLGMLCTDHADAYEEMGVDLRSGLDWSKLMFCAMLEDVRAAMPEVDFEDEAHDRNPRKGKTRFLVGDRVEPGPRAVRAGAERYDGGTVTAVKGDNVTVDWDSRSERMTHPHADLRKHQRQA